MIRSNEKNSEWEKINQLVLMFAFVSLSEAKKENVYKKVKNPAR